MLRALARRSTLCVLALAGTASATGLARAQDASAWQTDAHAASRVIAGSKVQTADASFLRAGIEIRLDPGWKTYWRYPGDTGVPPTFDFAGSANVKSVAVQWPAPELFSDDAGGHSIGYMGKVILPLAVTPVDPTQPSTLHVQLDYAVCGTLCIPAKAALALTLTGKSSNEGMLEKAERQVPKRVALVADSGDGLAILSVRREAADAHKEVAVEVAAPAGAPVELYAEGPTADWALPLPEPAGPPSGSSRRFTFDLDGLPPGAHAKGATLTFTAVSGADAIEVHARLD